MDSRNVFVFDGVYSTDYDLYVTGAGVEKTPVRSYEKVSVAGKSGDVLYDNGRYENVTISYPCIIMHEFRKKFLEMRCDMLCKIGYKELRDSFHPDMFRMACFNKASSPKLSGDSEAGTFEITFDCKPQWYLEDGQQPLSFTSAGDIGNPTNYEAYPLIEVTGYGSFSVGNKQVTIAQHTGKIFLDCELHEAYGESGNNMNPYVTAADGFPTIPAGWTGVTVDGVSLTIVPRWYII